MEYPCPTQDSNLDLKCNPQQGEGTGIVHIDCILRAIGSLSHVFQENYC